MIFRLSQRPLICRHWILTKIFERIIVRPRVLHNMTLIFRIIFNLNIEIAYFNTLSMEHVSSNVYT